MTRIKIRTIAAVAAVAIGALAAGPGIAAAAPGHALETIMQDDATFLYSSPDEVAAAMKRAKELGVDRIRLTANWAVLAPNADDPQRPSFAASDPDAYTHNGFADFDPVNYWAALDQAVRAATDSGLKVMIDAGFWAPRWATSDARPARRTIGIDTNEYAAFVKALVSRYSGSYVPSYGPPPAPAATTSREESAAPPPLFGLLGGQAQSSPEPAPPPAPSTPPASPLPRVSVWTVWNEPNHPAFLQPQWRQDGAGLVPNSPDLYRQLVDAAYPVIKQLEPDSTVLVGATSSIGVLHPRSTADGVPPLAFLRALACVDRRLRPITTGACAGYTPLEGDGWSHHPYELLHTPDWSDRRNPDNAEIGDLTRLTRLLDRLVAMHRIAPALRNVWLTEFGYESNPPDPAKPFSPLEQAQLINWAEYLAWRNPDVVSFPQFLMNDMGQVSAADQSAGKRAWGDWQSGLYYHDGTAKPAATSFAMAMHVHCLARRHRPRAFTIWGHVRPGAGVRRVTLERRLGRGRFSAFATVPTDASGYFLTTTRYTRRARFRFSYEDGGMPRTGIAEVPDSCSGKTPQKRVSHLGSEEY